MAKIRVLGEKVDIQRNWIRVLLLDWGRWHAADQSLPPHARLRTPGDPMYSDNTSIDRTHRAVLHVKELSFNRYLVLETIYEPPQNKSDQEVFDLIGARLGVSNLSGLRRLRYQAETMVASYRMGQAEALDENTACMY